MKLTNYKLIMFDVIKDLIGENNKISVGDLVNNDNIEIREYGTGEIDFNETVFDSNFCSFFNNDTRGEMVYCQQITLSNVYCVFYYYEDEEVIASYVTVL